MITLALSAGAAYIAGTVTHTLSSLKMYLYTKRSASQQNGLHLEEVAGYAGDALRNLFGLWTYDFTHLDFRAR